jgi:hypothetical protein
VVVFPQLDFPIWNRICFCATTITLDCFGVALRSVHG